MKWEYKSISFKDSGGFGTTSSPAEVEAKMNMLGKDGWELVATLSAATGASGNLLIFKRQNAEERRRAESLSELAG
ncbi:MAG: DUF4177 domain-containing protein [Gemmataceae bacterium]